MIQLGNNFQCSLCEMVFSRKHTASLHLEAKHFPTDRGYVCEICYEGYNTYGNFKKHRSMCRRQQENQIYP